MHFSYEAGKDGRVRIDGDQRLAVVLKDREVVCFLQRVDMPMRMRRNCTWRVRGGSSSSATSASARQPRSVRSSDPPVALDGRPLSGSVSRCRLTGLSRWELAAAYLLWFHDFGSVKGAEKSAFLHFATSAIVLVVSLVGLPARCCEGRRAGLRRVFRDRTYLVFFEPQRRKNEGIVGTERRGSAAG